MHLLIIKAQMCSRGKWDLDLVNGSSFGQMPTSNSCARQGHSKLGSLGDRMPVVY